MGRTDHVELIEQVLALQDDPRMPDGPMEGMFWWPKKILGDAKVQLMTMIAEGCHRRLIDIAWQESPPCSLPDDLLEIQGHCKHPPGFEEEAWPLIRRAWVLHEGRWWQPGLCRTYLDAAEKRIKAKASAEARWAKKNRPAEERRKNRASENGATASSRSATASRGHANASKNDANTGTGTGSGSGTGRSKRARPDGGAWSRRMMSLLEEVEVPVSSKGLTPGQLTQLEDLRRAGVRWSEVERRVRSVVERQQTKGDPVGSYRYLQSALAAVTADVDVDAQRVAVDREELVEAFRERIEAGREAGLTDERVALLEGWLETGNFDRLVEELEEASF